MIAGRSLLFSLAVAAIHSFSTLARSVRTEASRNLTLDYVNVARHENDLLSGLQPRDGDVVVMPLTPYKNSHKLIGGYTMTATLGSDEDDFKLIFDTGSIFLVVASDQLPASALRGIPKYEPPEKTCEYEEVRYGSGLIVNTMLVEDTVAMRDSDGNRITAQYKVAAMAELIADDKSVFYNRIAGLFGASIDSRSWTSVAVARSGFTVDLHQTSLSTVTFGKIDDSKAPGGIKWFPTSGDRTAWLVSSPDFDAPVVLDTGAWSIILPQNKVDEYFAPLGQAARRYSEEGLYMIKCDHDAPDWHFKIGDDQFTVSGSLLKSEEIGSGWCWSAISVMSSYPIPIIGVPFFHQYVTFFKPATGQIGIGARS